MPNRKIKEVLTSHAHKLMAVPGVVGVGEGESEGKPCIMVFVIDGKAKSLRDLPQSLEGFLLKIEESGQFQARITQ